MNGRLSWTTVVARTLLAYGPFFLLGVAWNAVVHSPGVAEEAPPGKIGPVDDDVTTPGESPALESAEELQAERDRLWDEAQRLHGEEKLTEAIAAGEQMLAIERRWLGDEDEEIVGSLEWLAATYAQAEDWASAEARWREVLSWREQHAAEDQGVLADVRRALAQALFRLKRYDDAIPVFEAIVHAYDKLERPIDAAWTYEWIASSHRDAGRDDQAVIAFAECLKRFEQIDHEQDLSWVVHEYAKALFRLRRFDDAITQFAAAAAEFANTQRTVEAAWEYDWIGASHRDAGRDDQAAVSYAECLARFDKMDHKENLSVTLFEYAKTLYRLKHYDDAVAQFELAAAAYEDVQQPIEAASMLGWVGDCHAARGDVPGAESAYRQAIERFGLLKQPAAEAKIITDLAWAYFDADDYARAEPLYRQALEIRKEILGEKHPDYATSLDNLAVLYYVMGDYARAEPLHRQALEIRKEVLGEKHPDYLWSLRSLAWRYDEMGDYARAEPLYRQALEIRKEVVGEKHPDYATSLYSLAGLYDKTGDYARAEPLYRQALEIRKEVLGETHPDYLRTLSSLAWLYNMMGEYARAEPLYQKVLDIRQEVLGEKHPDYATSLNNLAFLYCSMGEYALAEPLFRRALEVRQEVLGEKDPDYATSLKSLAWLYRSMGDYARAEPLYRQALEIRKEILGEQHPDYITSLNDLAMVYHPLGEYWRAEPLYQQALKISKAVLGEEHPEYALCLNNLAALYSDMGDYVRAEPLLRQVLEIRKKILGERHPDYAVSLNNLASLHRSLGDYVLAEPLFRQALTITKEVLGEKHPSYALCLNNLAALYVDMGDDAQAEPLYRQALAIRREILGERHPDYAMSLNNLAYLLFFMGDYARAEPLYRQAAEIQQDVLGQVHPYYAQSLNNLALLYDSMGDGARAEPVYRQAFDIVAEFVDATAVVRDEQGQLRLSYSVQYFLNSYLSYLLRSGDGAEAAYRVALNWKGATLVRQRAARVAADDEKLALVLGELQTVVRQWTAMATGPPQDDPRWKKKFVELADRKLQLEGELIAQSAAYRAATAKVQLEDLQLALPENAALVDYFELWFTSPAPDKPGQIDCRRTLVAFVVRAGRDVQLINLGDVAPIAAAIDQWRLSYGTTPEALEAGQLLRAKLWAPLKETIGDATLVLISPDGALGKLPFAALPGAEPDGFLIEDVALALVPVPQLIPALVQDNGDGSFDQELLLVGGVDYDRSNSADGAATPAMDVLAVARSRGSARETAAGMHWGALSGTIGETTAIGELFRTFRGLSVDAVAMLSGAEATEENFRALAPGRRVLHLATHGFFATEDKRSALAVEDADEVRHELMGDRPAAPQGHNPGLLSGLVLAGANAPLPFPDDPAQVANLPEDGILTAEELAFLPLGRVELVVLSACETGLGEVAGGEGLLGIQRAFQVAGARTTIATLWKVDDAMTQRLMTAFYRNALEGKESHLDALRNAQLAILRELRAAQSGAPTAADPLRGADAPADVASMARGAPYYWAAFTLSGDWR